MTIHLRSASNDDASALLDMMADFNRLEAIPWIREEGARALGTLLADDKLGVVLLASEAGDLVGYLILTWGFDLEWNGRDGFLTELYFVEKRRGRGLGRQALALAEDVARGYGVHALHLMVRPENIAAKRLYRGPDINKRRVYF